MPYYVYKISHGPTELVKQLELQQEFEQFPQAKQHARELRGSLPADSTDTFKVIFAANSLEAEERLLERREAPILREWEK
ncbi:MAG: hypothetical protein AMJ69_05055 [Gammaproteobacteria bacterium SG8_47]|nr:MAG: hypothetical protein AMJ69_05055 [Gammaproteobacteria bacterium SG8_47]